MGGREGHEGAEKCTGCAEKGRNGFSEPGQPDYRQCGGGGCGIRAGKFRRAHRGNLEEGGGEPYFRWDAKVPQAFSK